MDTHLVYLQDLAVLHLTYFSSHSDVMICLLPCLADGDTSGLKGVFTDKKWGAQTPHNNVLVFTHA